MAINCAAREEEEEVEDLRTATHRRHVTSTAIRGRQEEEERFHAAPATVYSTWRQPPIMEVTEG